MGLQGHFTPATPTNSTSTATGGASSATVTKPDAVSPQIETKTSAPTKTAKTEKPDTTQKQVEKLAEKAETASPEQLFDVVINGKQKQVTKDQLIRMAQKGEAADEKFTKASQIARQAEQVLEYFRSNPKKAMQELGHDVREFAEQTLADEIRKEMMSPEQKEAAELRRENEEMKKRLKEADDKAQAEKQAVNKARYAEKYDAELTAAMEQGGLIKNPATVRSVAAIMHNYLLKGYEVSALDAVQEYKETTQSQGASLIRLVGAEKAAQMLGDDFMNALRKEDLKKIKNPLTPSGDNGNYGTRAVPMKEKEEKLTMEEWKRRNRERISS